MGKARSVGDPKTKQIEIGDRLLLIVTVRGELTVKRLRLRGHRAFLEAENEAYAPMEITGDMEFDVWGVVTCVIHPL